jgi:2,4-dienoyl-CoA reductase-like NADH-dependent reductase (Old Yellow Enzyme family)
VAGEIWTGQDADKALDLGADFVALGRAAIGIPNWPSLVKGADKPIPKPPFTIEQLRHADLGEKFIEYMKKWKGFVDV